MKVAFLILAHYQPEHLARLVHSINADWNNIFIHVDRKVELDSFTSCINSSDHPVFLEPDRRVDVNWGGFSVVEAILSLLSMAYESENVYDRFCLLSGADFPIKTHDVVKSHFESDMEFMRIDRYLIPGEFSTHSRNISFHYFTDSKSIKDRELSGKISREPYAGMGLYQGSAWWSLTRGCIEHIIDYLEINPDYTDFHRTVFCSDEIYFHSIVKNSHFSEKLSHDISVEEKNTGNIECNDHGCHYIDWNASFCSLPKILKEEDGCALLYSGMLFARKFDQEMSSRILAKLESANNASLDNGSEKILVREDHENKSDREKVWLIGDARSGTSWLADLINFDSSYHYIFEPVHPHRNPLIKHYGLLPFRHPEQQDDILEATMNAVFTARIFPPDSRVAKGQALCPDKILVKDVFAHLMAKWTVNKIDGVKVIVLIRHPFAVAASKRKFTGAIWKTDPSSICNDKYLLGYLPDGIDGFLHNLQGEFEIQVAIWSIIHSVFFQQFQQDDYFLLYYENLCLHPERELGRIMQFLGKDKSAVNNALKKIDKINKYTVEGEFIKRGRENVTAWMEGVSEDELKFGARVLNEFYLDHIYDVNYLPVENSIRKFRSCMQVVEDEQKPLFSKVVGDDGLLINERGDRKQKYIMVISHMRSYSSLLCHILGSNPDISGYAESNLSYKKFDDIIYLHESIKAMTDKDSLSTYILDKLLHNYWQLPDEMLKSNRFRFIFLLREPKDTLQSIIYMTNGFSAVVDDKGKVEVAVNYYLSRLSEMMNMARRCHASVMFIKSEEILRKTDAVLNHLTRWLVLSKPLTGDYDLFSHTGRENYGDPSRYIRTGKVCAESIEKKEICIPEKLLERCQLQYQECYAVLGDIEKY